ncbi:MAG: universal stress protein [Chloroflexi bacterium]|nr:universal stress protein [Chloroflexota bacterium]
MTKLKVLIPLDGSEYSEHVIPPLLNLVKPETHAIVLVRVVPHAHGMTGGGTKPASIEMLIPEYESERAAVQAEHPIFASQAAETAIGEANDELAPIRRRLEERGFTVESTVLMGNPAHEIERFAADAQIDMIAMTTHGRTGLTKLLMGSVAEHVIRHVRVPVYLQRPGAGTLAEAHSGH